MFALVASFLCAVGIFFRDRGEVALEVLALRQQLAVLKRKRPRPVLSDLDRFFWTTLRSVWSRWTDVMVIVKPETVVAGTEPAFGDTGGGVPALAVADPRSQTRSVC